MHYVIKECPQNLKDVSNIDATSRQRQNRKYIYIKPSYLQGWGQVQLTKYTKYHKYIPSTSTGQVLIFLKSTQVHQVLSYQVQVLILKFVIKSGWTYRAE